MMPDITNDKHLQIHRESWEDRQVFSDCPQCSGTMYSHFWYRNGKRGDFIEAVCDECAYTFQSEPNREEVAIL